MEESGDGEVVESVFRVAGSELLVFIMGPLPRGAGLYYRVGVSSLEEGGCGSCCRCVDYDGKGVSSSFQIVSSS